MLQKSFLVLMETHIYLIFEKDMHRLKTSLPGLIIKYWPHHIAADLQYSRLSFTCSSISWIEMFTIYDKIDNLERYLGI